ncbi:MAG: hypothetical protein O7C73_08045 [Nitrospirae bacterium]|nr:hypothetical protein [Nitrospirota bacterium]
MFQEEKSFNFRFSLEAVFPEDYEGDREEYAWLQDWEKRIKPELLKVMFECIRRYSSWTAHVRNRGMSPDDEIEIVMAKDFSHDD